MTRATSESDEPNVEPLDDLAALSREAAYLAKQLDALARWQSTGLATNAAGVAPTREQLVRLAREELRMRRLREKMLPAHLFADPAWDILIDLFVTQHAGQPAYMSAISMGAPVPLTTALRWLSKLEASGLIERSGDPSDGRRVHVALTSAAEQAITQWLTLQFGAHAAKPVALPVANISAPDRDPGPRGADGDQRDLPAEG